MQLILYSSNDITVNESQPTVNYNAQDTLGVGDDNDSSEKFRSFVKFDLSSIPQGSAIFSATLTFTVKANTASNIRTQRVERTSASWDKTTMTWNNQPGVTGTELGNTSVAVAPGATVSFTLTASEIQQYVLGAYTNNGWRIKADTETDDNHEYYSSRNATESNRPTLTIEYSPPGGGFLNYLI